MTLSGCSAFCGSSAGLEAWALLRVQIIEDCNSAFRARLELVGWMYALLEEGCRLAATRLMSQDRSDMAAVEHEGQWFSITTRAPKKSMV